MEKSETSEIVLKHQQKNVTCVYGKSFSSFVNQKWQH